jgi:SWI/SNF-related matrix-associated actin-dependent regulator 1 of chromatin subfamily A
VSLPRHVQISCDPVTPGMFLVRWGTSWRDREKRRRCRDAMSGGRWDPRRFLWVVDGPKLHAIVRRIREAGFNVAVDADALSIYEQRELERVHDLSLVKDRLRRLDDAFRANGKSLYPFQFTGAAWLAERDRALLGDDQGLGKTVQVIAALPNDAPVVVVCPATLKGNWAKEFLMWRPSYRTSILSGADSFRWPRPGEVVVLNFDILPDPHGSGCRDRVPLEDEESEKGELPEWTPEAPLDQGLSTASSRGAVAEAFRSGAQRVPCQGCAPFLSEVPEGCVVVCDEIHWLKNEQTRRASRFRALAVAARAHKGRSWGASGTPLENRPSELWHVLSALDLALEAFGSYTSFVETCGGTVRHIGSKANGTYRYAGIKWEPEKVKPEAGQRIAAVCLRRMKRDVLQELPPKEWRIVEVEISPEDLRYVEEEMRGSGLSLESVTRAIEEGRGEAVFTKLSAARAALAAAKTRSVIEYVRTEFEMNDEPVVVFSAHRAPIEALGKRPGWATILGGVSPKRRTAIVDDFQAGRLKGIGLTYGAGAEGLTLTRAWNLVRVDRPWTPAKANQAADRVHRIGQWAPRVVYTDVVCSHPIDRRVTEILVEKERMTELTVDAAAERTGS